MTTAPLSSPGPADAHPSVEELADLAEGLVEPAEAARTLRRHLDGCAECRETAEALAEVRTLLGAVEPEPMPADVMARLEAALAEAALAEPALSEPALAEPALSEPALEVARTDAARRPQETRATAPRADTPTPPVRAAATPSAPPARPAAASGPGRPRPRRRRFALLLGAAAALAAVGLGGALLLNRADTPATTASTASTAAPGDLSARTPHLAGPGTDYREDQLAAQVRQLLDRSAAQPGLRATGPAKSGAAPADGAGPELAGPASPSACTAPDPGTPLATDRGSYQGSPADVLVYPAPGRPGFVDVYLRSPDCGPVLLHRTVPGR